MKGYIVRLLLCGMLLVVMTGCFSVRNVDGIKSAVYSSKFAASQASLVKESGVDKPVMNSIRIKYDQFTAGQSSYLTAVKARAHSTYVVDESTQAYDATDANRYYQDFISEAKKVIPAADIDAHVDLKIYQCKNFSAEATAAMVAANAAIDLGKKIVELNSAAKEEAYQRFAGEISAAEPIAWNDIK